MQSQNQRSMKKSNLCNSEQQLTASTPLFMHEDEMNSWLQYPLDDSLSYADCLSWADFLYSTPNSTSAVIAAAAPPEEIHASTAEIRAIASSPPPIIHQLRCTEGELPHRLQNFGHFSRLPEAISRNGTSSSGHSVRASTVVESNETPIAAVPELSIVSRVSDNVTPVSAVNGGGRTATNTTTEETSGGREVTTARELAMTSSTSGSGGSVSVSAEPLPPSHAAANAAVENRKRKRRESDDNEDQSEVNKQLASACFLFFIFS
ncbi:hypothetical protein K7X08_020400 [Anisodus acutangulus]|uniref:Uncharacterized protein n=1 Tax=Anisodus acutangulus TaxID=402998 RepID=A0A9Q1MA46_9SOLA|nr:hypothetical protein K7X08_020400 [Anisodus acutangulus]